MSSSDARPVVVAVKDPREAEAALAYATDEAVRTGSPLRLLHVVHPFPVLVGEMAVPSSLVGPAREMLETLADQAGERSGHRIAITFDVAEGLVAHTIDQAAEDARLVVLAGEPRPGLERLLTGSVRNGVAARARPAVVCVPPGWAPPQHRREVVAAGVDDPHHPSEVARCALEIGAERGSPVRLVHAWWFFEPFDDVGLSPRTAEKWSHVAEEAMRKSLADDLARYPELEVAVVAVHQRPAEALVKESVTASVLVLGRRDRRLPFGSHLGPIARAVLQSATGPVMVVETAAAPTPSG